MYNVYSLKLISGEEVIAKVDFDQHDEKTWMDSNYVTVHTPLVLMQTPQGVGAMPWVNTGENEVKLNVRSKDILAIVPSKDEVEAMYVKATSGIDVPTSDSSKLII